MRSFALPREALEFVRAEAADLVLSDFLMPEMDGLAFLSEVRDARPMVPRIILTGYADKGSAIKAINDIGLFQYIEKPWDNDALLITIRNGIEKHRLLTALQEKVSEISQAYQELESLNRSVLKAFV